MSAVAKAIGSVFNAVGDVLEAVGDVVEDVAEVVVDTVEYVVKNPEIIVISVAAPQLLPSIGITGAAIKPVTAGLISASQGGDLEDIGKAALGSFVGPVVGEKVGTAVASATAGSSLQNVLSSAASSGAASATGAAIQGGDVGTAFVAGAAGGAAASAARDIATGAQYGTDPFSEQTRQLVAQDITVNPFTGLAADIGSATGRSLVTGDLGQELTNVAVSNVTQTLSDQLRNAYATGVATEENQRATEALAQEIDENPVFAEQIQIAQIAKGNVPLTVDEQIDALAESIAREEFDRAAMGEQVAALPAVAIPIATNAAVNAARLAAPAVVRRISQFAANDPRFAQTVVTNNYVQQMLSVAGLAATVASNGDVIIETLTTANESPAETARLLRYATEVQRQVPQVKPEQIQQLERETQVADLVARRDELTTLQRSGYNVARELERVNIEIQRQIPLIEAAVPKPTPAPVPRPVPAPTTPVIEPSRIPSPANDPAIPRPTPAPTRPVVDPTKIPPAPNEPAPRPTTPVRVPSAPPTIEPNPVIVPRQRPRPSPATTPTPAPSTAPGVTPAPGVMPLPGTQPLPLPGTQPLPEALPSPEALPERVPLPSEDPFALPRQEEDQVLMPRPEEETLPLTRPSQMREPATKGPGTSTMPRVPTEPIDIETLFTDEEILKALEEQFAEEETAGEFEAGTSDAMAPAAIDFRPAGAGEPARSISLTPRQVGQGVGAITGRKEPVFGGDPGTQQDVWNIRSLRLKRALGL